MSVPHKVTPGWACKENCRELAAMNRQIYRELREKYKIAIFGGGRLIEEDKWDVIIQFQGGSYSRNTFYVYKNAPKLSDDELALLCDEGNLCFGYSGGSYIDIYTD